MLLERIRKNRLVGETAPEWNDLWSGEELMRLKTVGTRTQPAIVCSSKRPRSSAVERGRRMVLEDAGL